MSNWAIFWTKFFVALFFSAFSLGALSRDAVPIVDHIDIPVLTSSGKQLDDNQVRNAIIIAAQNRGWLIGQNPSLNIVSASLNVRGKHTVMVTIPFSIEKFSIKYANSVNMKYSVQDRSAVSSNPYVPAPNSGSVRVIHPRYNDWVQDLLRSIQAEFLKL